MTRYRVWPVDDPGDELQVQAPESELAAIKYGRVRWAEAIAHSVTTPEEVEVAVEELTVDGRIPWASEGPEVFTLSLAVHVVARWDRHVERR